MYELFIPKSYQQWKYNHNQEKTGMKEKVQQIGKIGCNANLKVDQLVD